MTNNITVTDVRKAIATRIYEFNAVGVGPSKTDVVYVAPIPRSNDGISYRYEIIHWMISEGALVNLPIDANGGRLGRYYLWLTDKGVEALVEKDARTPEYDASVIRRRCILQTTVHAHTSLAVGLIRGTAYEGALVKTLARELGPKYSAGYAKYVLGHAVDTDQLHRTYLPGVGYAYTVVDKSAS